MPQVPGLHLPKKRPDRVRLPVGPARRLRGDIAPFREPSVLPYDWLPVLSEIEPVRYYEFDLGYDSTFPSIDPATETGRTVWRLGSTAAHWRQDGFYGPETAYYSAGDQYHLINGSHSGLHAAKTLMFVFQPLSTGEMLGSNNPYGVFGSGYKLMRMRAVGGQPQLQVVHTDPAGGLFYSLATTLGLGSWSVVAFTQETAYATGLDRYRLYVNGQMVVEDIQDEGTLPAVWVGSDAPSLFGNYNNSFVGGQMMEARISSLLAWTNPLTIDQMATVWEALFKRYQEGLGL